MKNMRINSKVILLFSVILVFIFFIIRGKIEKSKIDKHGVYLIFDIYDVKFSKVEPKILFIYYYEGKKIRGESFCSYTAINKLKTKRILGKIIPTTNENYACCFCEIPNEVKQPDKGWYKLPEKYCDSKEEKCL